MENLPSYSDLEVDWPETCEDLYLDDANFSSAPEIDLTLTELDEDEPEPHMHMEWAIDSPGPIGTLPPPPVAEFTKPSERARGFFVTWNNPTMCCKDFASLWEKKGFIWGVCELEHATPTDIAAGLTPHIQGSFWSEKERRFNTLATMVKGTRFHIQRCKGSPTQNRAYCSKEHSIDPTVDFWEFGVMPKDIAPLKGRTGAMKRAIDVIDKGGRLRDCDPTAVIMFGNGLTRYMSLKKLKPADVNSFEQRVTVEFWHGLAATHKTTTCHLENDWDDTYFLPKGGTYWDGYDGQRTIVIDDFHGRGSRMDLDWLLTICDQWPFWTNIKHGGAWVQAKKVILISNTKPNSWYDYRGREETYNALVSRFGSRVRCFKVEPEGSVSNKYLDEAEAKEFLKYEPSAEFPNAVNWMDPRTFERNSETYSVGNEPLVSRFRAAINSQVERVE